MSATAALEIISALNTLLQLLQAQDIGLEDLVDEYYAAEANGEQLSAADVERLKGEAREALDRLKEDLRADSE